MDFGEFLHYTLKKRNISSVAQLYIELGSEQALNMSLRNFNLIAAGKLKPTVNTFISVFNQLEREEQKIALESFFLSFTNNSKILSSIRTNFICKYEKPKDAFSKSRGRKKISVEQLEYILSSSRAIRLHHYMVLFDEINLESIEDENDLKILEDFVKIGLAKKEKSKLCYINPYSRLPTFRDSPPNEVRQTSNLLIETMKTFLSLEGSDQQTLEYFCGNFSKDSAFKIHEELKKIKDLCLNIGESTTNEETVPIVGVLFGKTLLGKDLL